MRLCPTNLLTRLRSSMIKGKSYCEFIWKTKVLPDINTVEYNKDLYDNPS